MSLWRFSIYFLTLVACGVTVFPHYASVPKASAPAASPRDAQIHRLYLKDHLAALRHRNAARLADNG